MVRHRGFCFCFVSDGPISLVQEKSGKECTKEGDFDFPLFGNTP